MFNIKYFLYFLFHRPYIIKILMLIINPFKINQKYFKFFNWLWKISIFIFLNPPLILYMSFFIVSIIIRILWQFRGFFEIIILLNFKVFVINFLILNYFINLKNFLIYQKHIFNEMVSLIKLYDLIILIYIIFFQYQKQKF